MSISSLLKCKTLVLLPCRSVLRSFSTKTDGEVRIAKLLKEKFPLASSLKVVDISGGCGAMYEIHIESDEFRGKRTVQQHQLVNQSGPHQDHHRAGIIVSGSDTAVLVDPSLTVHSIRHSYLAGPTCGCEDGDSSSSAVAEFVLVIS
ncbi:hypothetical protein NFI96_026961 [Prochilodus magdalenae]|nr:hypothetical protein NFI96_026961 [Prochilodus magdalenae]